MHRRHTMEPAGERGRDSVQTRMLQALVAFATIMTGAAMALAQTVTPDDPGIAEPGPVTNGAEAWWWWIAIAVIAVVVISLAMRRRGRGPR
ncbi:hypothetical protein [Salinarimonas ramus]|uniref:Uncharacterized protein n=1 Tax=Salinarimonas ramus TaxID=690164 RepID=A0A917QAT2_9HYPH|nr:hypothetical protein [Salinarimonas ramus]GGK40308.1 hypothetical protein GCM10011322_29320 [Salinarimonas ramus]